jgi:hypothetical protein
MTQLATVIIVVSLIVACGGCVVREKAKAFKNTNAGNAENGAADQQNVRAAERDPATAAKEKEDDTNSRQKKPPDEATSRTEVAIEMPGGGGTGAVHFFVA